MATNLNKCCLWQRSHFPYISSSPVTQTRWNWPGPNLAQPYRCQSSKKGNAQVAQDCRYRIWPLQLLFVLYPNLWNSFWMNYSCSYFEIFLDICFFLSSQKCHLAWFLLLCAAFSHSGVSNSLQPQWAVAHQGPLSMGILQTRILEWVAMPSSKGPSQPRDWAWVSLIADGCFTIWATREAQKYYNG